jgi:hypothetical protein
MWEDLALATEMIDVKLLEEGTNAWLSVPGEKIDETKYRLLIPDSYDPEDTKLEYLPGEIVTVTLRTLPDGTTRKTATG